MAEGEGPKGINILCIDGGGIRGLSSLVLLGEIMGRLGELEGRYEWPNPSEYFDVIAGTGTGGISACMLGRLRMPLEKSIAMYVKLVSGVFSNKEVFGTSGSSAYKGTQLQEALKSLVQNATENENERMRDEKSDEKSCKTMVFAMSKHNLNASIPIIFRSYQSMINPAPDCTIWEALYATMAHPDLFKSIDISDGTTQQSFVGGELGCSNPVSHVLAEVRRLYPEQHVSCVLSIGAGHARTISLPDPGLPQRLINIEEATAMKDMATDSERVAEEMAARFQDTKGVYYRFNVDQGMQNMNTDDWENLKEVMAHTRAYTGKVEPSQGIEQAAQAIKERKPTIPLKLIDGRIQTSSDKPVVGIKHCPAPSSVFTGREDLIQQVGTCIVGSADERRVCVVRGLGGAGKTQLALKSIERYRDSWIHVLYVDASSSESLESTLQDIAKAKDLGKTLEDTLRWLESCREPWLLVYDNADDPLLNIHKNFPSGNRGSILITTRLSDMRFHAKGPGSDCCISRMNYEDASALLSRLAHIQGQIIAESETEAADALLKDFGHLALAIVHAGAYIGHSPQMSISKYRELFLAHRRSMLERYGKLKVKVDDYQWSVFTTWKLCYDLLAEGGDSRPLLWLIAFVHHDHITEEIFKRATINIQGHKPLFPPTAVETAARSHVQEFLSRFLDENGLWDTLAFLDAINELAAYSLIDFDRINSTYNIHVLVQEWARTVISQPANLALECATTLVAHAVDWGNSTQSYRSRLGLAPHVIKVLSERQDRVSPNHACSLAKVFEARGSWDQQEALEIRFLETAEIVLGARHRVTLSSMVDLASIYVHQGRWDKAEVLEVKVLDARRQLLGEEHQDTLTIMSNLASTYVKQGRWGEAEPLQLKGLDACSRLLGEEHPHTLLSMAHLASTYSNQGRWSEAEQLELKVLDARKRLHSEEHPDTLTSMGNLAVTYASQGRLSEAATLEIEVLDLSKRLLGEEHPDTLMCMSNLASTYSDQGRWDDAEVLLIQAVEVGTRVRGEQHPDTAIDRNELAHIRSKRQKAKCDAGIMLNP